MISSPEPDPITRLFSEQEDYDLVSGHNVLTFANCIQGPPLLTFKRHHLKLRLTIIIYIHIFF